MSSPIDDRRTMINSSENRGHGVEKAPDSAAGGGQNAGPAFDIRIAADGTWYHEGAPIRRLAIAKLFATVLTRDDNGDYWLVTPAEKGRIEVEDAPFVAVELTIEGDGPGRILRFRTNLDHQVEVDRDHPIRVAHGSATGEPRPYVRVKEGLEALIVRSVYYQLVEVAEPHAGRIGVWSKNTFHPLDQDS